MSIKQDILLRLESLIAKITPKSPKKKPKDASVEERRCAAYAQLLFWIKASMLCVDEALLDVPRAKLGMHLFFIGSADYHCQNYDLDDVHFYHVAAEGLKAIGVPELEAQILLANYPKIQQNEFGSAALLEGGRRVAEWVTRSNPNAPMILAILMGEWSENPDIPEELNDQNLIKYFIKVTGL